MPLSTDRGSVNDALWKHYKQDIYSIYMVQNLSLAELIAEMKKKHQFVETKPRYERYLREWGFRKNFSPSEWRNINQVIREREAEGKASDVWSDSRQISHKKVKKACSRYGRVLTTSTSETSSLLPKGIQVRTPPSSPTLAPAQIQDRFLVPGPSTAQRERSTSTVATPKPSWSGSSRIDALPFAEFRSLINEQANSTMEHLLLMKQPTAGALIEFIFTLAMEDRDVCTVVKIMQSCSHSNMLKCSRRGERVTPLQRACELGSLELVQAMITTGADLEEDNHTLLFKAVRAPQVDLRLVQLLIGAGANVNLLTDNTSPLMAAASAHNSELVRLLLEAGANPNLGTFIDGRVPLSCVLACGGRMTPAIATIVDLLLDKTDLEVLVLRTDGGYHTLLEELVSMADPELLQKLLSLEREIPESALVDKIRSGDLEHIHVLIGTSTTITLNMVKASLQLPNFDCFDLLSPFLDKDVKYECLSTVFTQAIRLNRRDWIEKLHKLEITPSVGPDLAQAFGDAADRGDIRTFRLLLGKDSLFRRQVLQFLDCAISKAIARAGRRISDNRYNSSKSAYGEIIELLLAINADVRGDCRKEWKTPLMQAICNRDESLTRQLLNTGASVHIRDLRGDASFTSVLPTAVSWGHRPLIQRILESGGDPNALDTETRKTALTVAVEKGDFALVRFLIDGRADVNRADGTQTGNTPLVTAVRGRNIEMVRYLLGDSVGADINEMSLVAAVSSEKEEFRTDLMEILLTARIGRYGRITYGLGCLALRHAITVKNAPVIEVMLAKGVNPTEPWQCSDTSEHGTPQSALETAVELDDTEDFQIVRRLLDYYTKSANMAKESHMRGALNAAICRSDRKNVSARELVVILLDAGAEMNPNPATFKGMTPLELALQYRKFSIVDLLLERGADPISGAGDHPLGISRPTALQFAASMGYITVTSKFIEKSAMVHVPSTGVCAVTRSLEAAIENGRTDTVVLLLRAGAMVSEKARRLATSQGYLAIGWLLDEYHARQQINT